MDSKDGRRWEPRRRAGEGACGWKVLGMQGGLVTAG